MQAQVGARLSVPATSCNLELVHAFKEDCDRWTNHPYCIPWTWVDEGAWAKTYRCVSRLRSMLPCLQSLLPMVP